MQWFKPAIVMVGTLMLIGLATGSLILVNVPHWGVAAALALACVLVASVGTAMFRKAPIKPAIDRALRALPLLMVAGLTMPAYNGVKTLLNQMPMWADPYLAKIDLALFGWLYLDRFATDFWNVFYYLAWLLALALTMACVGMRAPTRERDALIVGWFVMWCVLAPLVQALLPAGGPIFYERLGQGDLFSDYPFAQGTLDVSDYLWTYFTAQEVGFSTGISAMPSLHVAASAWVVLAWRGRTFELTAWLFAGVIFILSVALGWHYALDGIVGGAMAIASVRLGALILGAGEARRARPAYDAPADATA